MFKKLLIPHLFISSLGFSQIPEEFRKIVSISKSETKKIKYKQWKEALKQFHAYSVDQQRSKLYCVSEVWKDDPEQIDDVCIIDVRL